jgi:spore coat protein U-like protein
MRIPLAVLVLGIGLSAPRPAIARYTCTVGATDVAFGQYSAINPSIVDTTGTVTVDCTRINGNQTFAVLVAISAGSSGSFNPRTMTNGIGTLNYYLYRDSARTQIWGDGTGGSQTQTTASCTLRNKQPTCSLPLTIYGRIPAGQNVPPGYYPDTLILTITF